MDLNEAFDARLLAALAPLSARVAALEARGVPVPVPSAPAPALPSRLALGVNVERARYWSPSWPFNDLVRTSGGGATPWIGSQVALDADGWPLGLAPGESVYTVLADDPHYPGGTYTVAWFGSGTVELTGDVAIPFSSPAAVTIVPRAGLGLRITRSDPKNPVRGVQVRLAGGLFREGFLARLRPFGVLRFMDWANVNNSVAAEWKDRPQLTARTWLNAVPYEVQIDLANALGVPPWLCTPRNATDDFARELGALVARRIPPVPVVYVEHWNEHWNKGQSADTQPAAYGKRAAQIMAAFVAGLRAAGSSARVVRVLGGQAANPDVARQALSAAPAGSFDAIAHAPYLGGSLGTRPEVASWTADQVLAALALELEPVLARMVACHALARSSGLTSIAYEGGQHLVGVGALAESAPMTALFAAVNRDPRMEGVYADYLRAWKETGGGLFCHFQDTGPSSKHGSWGAWEWHDQPDPPKARALLSAAREWAAL